MRRVFILKFRLLLMVSLLIAAAPPVRSAEVHIDIERLESSRTQVGVLGFETEPGAESEVKSVRDILMMDLKRSLAFQLTDLSQYPSSKNLAPEDVKKIAGDRIEIILTGKVKKEGDQFKLNAALYNGKTGKWMWERVFGGSKSSLRMISHRTSGIPRTSTEIPISGSWILRPQKDGRSPPED
ncbi:MAG: hypothetical protein HYR81_01325 [Nitrospirae bacterium]|nr:hypothetical protein [Nitrospirota bacterium]